MTQVDRPFYQKILRWTAFLLAGLVSLGALLDAVSNAVSLVAPRVTYVTSAALLVIWLLIELVAALFGIRWLSGGQLTRLRSLGPQVRLGLVGVLILFWIPRLGDLPIGEPTVPSVAIKLTNSSKASVKIARRGEFVLWLPSALYDGAPRVGGRFTFLTADDRGYEDSPIILKAGGKKTAAAKLLGESQFIRYLERGDTDLTLIAATGEGLSFSPTMPFSRAAVTSRYLEWEVSKENSKGGHDSGNGPNPAVGADRRAGGSS